MKYGVLGTGDVARTIATKLIAQGHEVMMGARSGANAKAADWAEALEAAGRENLAGKVLIDLTNPYLYKDGHISLDPRWSGTTCLGEAVQEFLPETKVVKTLNYLCNALMTCPDRLPEPITGFYCGNDVEAKAEVAALLKDFGWTDTLDLGGIAMSRYTEMLGAFWPAALNATGNMEWGFRLVRKR